MTQPIISNTLTILDDYIEIWIEGFIQAKISENLSKKTIEFYKYNLKIFINYCEVNSIKKISQITPSIIRDLLIMLESKGHSDGGIHAVYRVIKVFLRWFFDETDPEYSNPINKVKPPKLKVEALEGISNSDFERLLSVCTENTFTNVRDRTILLLLMETGVRASELCNIDIQDINFVDGSILIRQGKGAKPRWVFIGKTTRKQIRKWLKFRGIDGDALFTNINKDRLVFVALREIVRRACKKAGIKEYGLHALRRSYALESIRKGVDILTLSRLMGHTSLQLLLRYVKQDKTDLLVGYKSIVDD